MTEFQRFKKALRAVAKTRWPRNKASFINVAYSNGKLSATIKLDNGFSYWAELEQDRGDEMVVVMRGGELITVSVPR